MRMSEPWVILTCNATLYQPHGHVTNRPITNTVWLVVDRQTDRRQTQTLNGAISSACHIRYHHRNQPASVWKVSFKQLESKLWKTVHKVIRIKSNTLHCWQNLSSVNYTEDIPSTFQTTNSSPLSSSGFCCASMSTIHITHNLTCSPFSAEIQNLYNILLTEFVTLRRNI